MLEKMDRAPKVVMYNKVLAKYTSTRGSVAKDVPVTNLHKWLGSWWRQAAPGKFGPPTIPGDRYAHDWPAIQEAVLPGLMSGSTISSANWGHLIVDEGQDFPEAMYATLKTVLTVAGAKGAKPEPAVTVLADENQRLQPGKNSTIEEIRRSLGLHSDTRNVFALKKNYRNTLEIAAFAAQFYVGLPSGIPETPTKHGPPPVVSTSAKESEGQNLNAFCEKIARYANARRTEEIGVFVPNNHVRKSIINRLAKRVEAAGIVVQSYANNDEQAQADDLVFDVGGRITVLNYQSAKGLEFDAVFVIDPGRLLIGGSSELNAKMCLYVMCSRARSFLNVMLAECEQSQMIRNWCSVPTCRYESEIL
jgi:DNA helicase IV